MKKVMIVVDSPAVLVEMSEVLEQHNLEPNSAKDVEEALALLENDLKPELIIVDSDMLGKDTAGFVQQVRAIIGLHFTPILILDADWQRVENGADQSDPSVRWLGKPLQGEQLLQQVRRYLPGV